jgi:phosphoribosylamine--glycine ligase
VNILLVGGGGREHALAWKLSQSAQITRLVVTPGNAAITTLPKTTWSSADPNELAATERFDLAVIGPEAPLAAGLADRLRALGIPVFGPSLAAAQLETSKGFAKRRMQAWGIPTAGFEIADTLAAARIILADWPVEQQGVVIKADGLAAGKGVVVTRNREEAERTLTDFLANPANTIRAESVVIEHILKGREVSAFALCDGHDFRMLGYACDYKRLGDGDTGPNTGGMGGYAPLGWPSPAVKQATETIVQQVLDGMRAAGMPFVGTLFIGLMVDGDDAHVLEFNTRFGDPETQTLLPLMQNDLVPLLLSAANGALAASTDEWSLREGTAVHVVMASGGYPAIDGSPMVLEQSIAFGDPALIGNSAPNGPWVFIAGARQNDANWINTGGRVLGVTALGATVEEARTHAYQTLAGIHFTDAQWRHDIGR